MKIDSTLSWPQTFEEAVEIQKQLQPLTILEDRLGDVRYVAGVDVGFKQDYIITQAAVAVLSFPELQLVESAIAQIPTTFPYVPGFLSFREIPAILKALEKLSVIPDLILCDGQGTAHPRRFGIACHLGVLIDVPTIGVAKTLFVGKHDEVAPTRGSWQPLRDRSQTIGAVLRTQNKINPLYVSSGHRISLASAIDYVLLCTPKYRLPETTRWADKLASDR
jgi:deoxyribonuclease V